MGHQISGFIGRPAPLRLFADSVCHTHIAPLPQGFAFLPIQVDVLDQCDFDLRSSLPDVHPEFERLFPELIVLAHQYAQLAPIAYVETDYFGGVGTQAAICWEGSTSYGPLLSETRAHWQLVRWIVEVAPAPQRAINRILQRLGVQCAEASDEFATLGLGRFRSNEAWIEHVQANNDSINA